MRNCDVVIVNYNAGKLLAESVQSVLAGELSMSSWCDGYFLHCEDMDLHLDLRGVVNYSAGRHNAGALLIDCIRTALAQAPSIPNVPC